MILQFPKTKLHHWAKSYAVIFAEHGQIEAGRYARANIPEQFQKQLDPLVQEEYAKLIKEKE